MVASSWLSAILKKRSLETALKSCSQVVQTSSSGGTAAVSFNPSIPWVLEDKLGSLRVSTGTEVGLGHFPKLHDLRTPYQTVQSFVVKTVADILWLNEKALRL